MFSKSLRLDYLFCTAAFVVVAAVVIFANPSRIGQSAVASNAGLPSPLADRVQVRFQAP